MRPNPNAHPTVINVGIIGGETESAGELIRILINHPDVILRAVCSPEHAGCRIDRFHRGLIGDTDLCFVKTLDNENLNCVFLVGEPWQAQEYMRSVEGASHCQDSPHEEPEEMLHIIDMTGAYRDGSDGMIYGFPEYRRKALVRGALRASISSVVATIVELALFPMAKNHLLHGPIYADVQMPAGDWAYGSIPLLSHEAAADLMHHAAQMSTRLDPVAPAEKRPDVERSAEEVENEMRDIDGSFSGKINIVLGSDPSLSRGVCATVEVPCGINIDEVRRLYEEAYSDHSFTFVIDRAPAVSDVSNTNKCLLYIEPGDADLSHGQEPSVKIRAVMDCYVKGCAGNAVHCMNLLFGLSERTGLALKASSI